MSEADLSLEITPQPDETTCGPACLASVYRYFGDTVALDAIVAEVESLDEGGTLDVFLACHALERGYRSTIYTYNLNLFDPTWFQPGVDVGEKLRLQAQVKHSRKLQRATGGYRKFLKLGGELRFRDLTGSLLRQHLGKSVPIMCGLSATYLYGSARERAKDCEDDDIRGEPLGHFVVLSGYDPGSREVRIADPYQLNPITGDHYYAVKLDRLVGAIFLGIVTYDANLLVIEPGRASE